MTSAEDIVVAAPAEGVVVQPMSWFDSPGPFEVEIGCGKGGFLLSRARHRPDLRFLGIEWANKYYKYCADRMARWRIGNVRVMRTDARHFVMHHLPPGSVSVFHLYHPDPWPKKRHHKRRMVQPEFIDAVARVLIPGGCWLIQSDHDECFGWMRKLLDPRPELASVSWGDARHGPGPDWEGTNYEIKTTRVGATIHRAAYVRR